MSYYISAILSHGAAVKELRVRRRDGGSMAPWQAGDHIALECVLPDGKLLERHYSLIGIPGASDEYRIAVLLEPSGNGGSAHLHTSVKIGDMLTMRGPFHAFPMQAGTGRTLLVAGGIGITPFISMAHMLSGQAARYELHYLARSRERVVLIDEIAVLPGATVFAYTPESGNARPDLAPILATYCTGDVLYACGPATLIQAIRHTANELGWPAHAMHFESFGARAAAADQPLTVHLAQSGMTVQVSPGTSILDALVDAGAFVSFQCKKGECGSCYAALVDGSPIHRDSCLTPSQQAGGICTCVSWGASEHLVLDL